MALPPNVGPFDRNNIFLSPVLVDIWLIALDLPINLPFLSPWMSVGSAHSLILHDRGKVRGRHAMQALVI